MKRILGWVLAHKVKSALLLLLIFVVVELATIPWISIGALRTVNPTETALMRQRKSEADADAKPYRVTQRWIALSRVPRHVQDAIIVAEDGTFYSHGGFDWYEVQESIEKNIEKRRAARGASTITQQLAKNLYLSTSKDPIRKAKEAIITLLLEGFLPKSRILELYVNCIEWGRGIFGIEAASQAYFGKPAASLTLEEGARLAAVIPSPLRHRPDADSPYVLRRKQIVLNRMAARNSASQSQSQEMSSRPTDQAVLPATDATDSSDTDEGDDNGL
jgi:monofunctional biosynthetic peptidoglycan transglycosylase